MNEQIKELVTKAFDKAIPYTWDSLDYIEVEKLMETFAELLVNECADISDASFHDGSSGYLAIKKYFRVKQ